MDTHESKSTSTPEMVPVGSSVLFGHWENSPIRVAPANQAEALKYALQQYMRIVDDIYNYNEAARTAVMCAITNCRDDECGTMHTELARLALEWPNAEAQPAPAETSTNSQNER